MKRVAIIGGGLGGLISAIHLSKHGVECIVFEKKSYPFHRVCGEYISNEVAPFLKSLDVFPASLIPSQLKKFQLSAINGKSSILDLDLGGFGISRYAFDYFIYQKAKAQGVIFYEKTEVVEVHYTNDVFTILTNDKTFHADVVIGSFGKRSRMDASLKRDFLKSRSPYVGIKYHVKNDFPKNLVALHNFEGGYCGVNAIENDLVNICYLTHRDVLRKNGGIENLEKKVLYKNPHLKEIFESSSFLFEKPESINEISFATKEPVHNHILMVGDAAGMITPLCGNGMALAIHAAKIASEQTLRFCNDAHYTRSEFENGYASAWKKLFANRLWYGRQVQKLFGSHVASNIAVHLLLYSKFLSKAIVKGTHGKPF